MYVSQVFSLGLLVIGSNTSAKQSKIIGAHVVRNFVPAWAFVLQPANFTMKEIAKWPSLFRHNKLDK